MTTTKARPTGVERTFGADEIIVSKTDLQGRLTYTNDVFIRVSAYDEHDLMGQPHNIIRHPDMPGGVFKLLWDTIGPGSEIFAYVLNLADDGAHYWVLAHVTPSRDTSGAVVGYHSNRRLPSPAAIREVEPLYRTLLSEETPARPRTALRGRRSRPARGDAGRDGRDLRAVGLGHHEQVHTMIGSLRQREKATDNDAFFRAVTSEWLRVVRAAAEGDFEERVRFVPGCEVVPDAVEFRDSFNLLLDRMDAYVRESAASLEAASSQRFWRRFLRTGMAGSFEVGAKTINGAITSMAATQQCLDEANQRRIELADELEQTVLHVAEQLASASTELSATSVGLADSARAAVADAQAADCTAHQVETAAGEIEGVVKLISAIASQTQLLALNATIEAAHAGDVGRGFAIVASEVKKLADTTTHATEKITGQVHALQTGTEASAKLMDSVEANVQEMAPLADAVRIAVDGTPTDGSYTEEYGQIMGLARMAELLRAEVTSFLSTMRGESQAC
ncbi:MAG: methyl-accepting chemotaxis protein [Nocardioidaceae bacterium]